WRVLDRQRKAPTRRIIGKVASAGHAAEPLARIPFNHSGPCCQFLACRRPIGRQILEESEAIAEGTHQHGLEAGAIPQDFAGKSVLFRLVERRHVIWLLIHHVIRGHVASLLLSSTVALPCSSLSVYPHEPPVTTHN